MFKGVTMKNAMKNNEMMEAEFDNWLEDDDECMTSMMDFLKIHHETTLGLTTLILQHCHAGQACTKEQVFKIFNEASATVAQNMAKQGEMA
jgi:hypothetical protein